MANPAPTINQINAFNATQGTTIDFNIIGGTDLVRSNIIYIYDLDDNSLICTHLYVSTESIHELPSNTDASMVYESGKSSADFVNGAQYYAQIQTFTDIAGTQGGSGLSVAKMFWCLDDPTLTIDTIPSTISTTSYNVSATYNANTSVVSNIIQQYQFSLYSATGSLLQSSGVIVGSGEQQGTSTAYDISYNFTGLSVGSSYYTTVEVTTTQGMSVSAQSNTFTVSIDTPTIGSASVVNNGCDGYISVTSSLSSEYEHEESSEVGEIMSFTTDSVNNIIELDVDFEPVQDDTPWMSAQDKEPYMFRAVPTQTEDFGHESDTIVGGTVGWNQLLEHGNFDATTGWNGAGYGAITVANNICNYTLSEAAGSARIERAFVPTIGHKTLVTMDIKTPYATGVFSTFQAGAYNAQIARASLSANTWATIVGIRNVEQGDTTSGKIRFYVGNTSASVGDVVQFRNGMIIDLTQMFGSTIADYIYSLEQANAGAGVAWFRKLFPNAYYSYDSGSLVSVSGLTSHDMVGFNQWDEEYQNGYWSTSDGTYHSSSGQLCSKNYIAVVPNTAYYYYKGGGTTNGEVLYFDANKAFISSGGQRGNQGFTTPDNCRFIQFNVGNSYGATYKNDICINLSDASLNGTYKPHVKHSYSLDNTLTLRGIPKLDNGKLKYDGDIYHADGSVDRRYGIVDLGTLTWIYQADYQGYPIFYSLDLRNVIKKPLSQAEQANILCEKYIATTRADGISDKNLIFINTGGEVDIRDTAYTDAASFKTAMSGVYLVYEKATPTTETADPYTNPQAVDPSGTEEYVGSPIPVGHKTTYQRICPITGWTGCEVDVSGVNLFDGEFNTLYKLPQHLSANTFVTASCASASNTQIRYYDIDGNQIDYWTLSSQDGNRYYKSFKLNSDTYYVKFTNNDFTPTDMQIEVAESTTSLPSPYEAPTTYPVSWQTEAGTVYGGTVDVVSGVLTAYLAENVYDGSNDEAWGRDGSNRYYIQINAMERMTYYIGSIYCDKLPTVKDHNVLLSQKGISGYVLDSSYPNQNWIYVAIDGVNTVADLRTWLSTNPIQVVYPLATPQTYQLTPQQMQTLSGQNNVWSNTNGGMYLVYQLPITSLLVKRRDVADVSGKWLTLYSTPITQASDMDFTFIDFLNQYGKKYQYALVPVLAQDQSGVIVQIEGGYTVSDNVDSIFDGVYIADQTNVERVKAGAGYGNIDMNQGVGSITPIGSKYPIVITNSQNQYHNGSVRGTIVPNDFYSNGNLSRIDMVNKRDELEQFLTNKRAKIIKDWNGKMWLVMIMSNVACSFDDNYGMGMVSFSADWLEVGDPTNQQDLYNAGLINVGGV